MSSKTTKFFDNVTTTQIEGAMETRVAMVTETASQLDTSESPVAVQLGQGEIQQEVLDTINGLIKTGHVMVKIKSLALNPFDANYVDLFISEELTDIKVTMLWDIGLTFYVGHRRFLW